MFDRSLLPLMRRIVIMVRWSGLLEVHYDWAEEGQTSLRVFDIYFQVLWKMFAYSLNDAQFHIKTNLYFDRRKLGQQLSITMAFCVYHSIRCDLRANEIQRTKT